MSFQFNTRVLEAPVGILVVHLNGRLIDQNVAVDLLNAVEDHILDGNKYLIINLSKLEHINSSGLNTLVNILTKSRNEGGETMLCNISKNVESLFIMTKLNTVFTIAEQEKEAINQMEAFVKNAD